MSTSKGRVSKAKFWLDPVRLERNLGFGRMEIRRIQKLVERNADLLLRELE